MTDPTPNDLPVPTPLSLAAQAVMDAYRKRYAETLRPGPFVDHWQELCAAAALHAAAMRTLLTSEEYEGSTPDDYELGWNAAVAYLKNIANELEARS